LGLWLQRVVPVDTQLIWADGRGQRGTRHRTSVVLGRSFASGQQQYHGITKSSQDHPPALAHPPRPRPCAGDRVNAAPVTARKRLPLM
jgi:hypothetical protein